MSRISRQALCNAIAKVRAMDLKQKEQFADELFHTQPHMFGAFLVQKQMGVSLGKMEFLLEVLFICFQAMKESGLTWPLITEDEQDRQMARYVATIKFGEGLNATLQERVMKDYIASHPERELLAFVLTEATSWLNQVVPEDTDKYVMMAAANLVNCIAFVSMPTST